MQGTALSNQETQHQCQQCTQFIQDRYYLQVMDKTWHLNCLRCVDCKLSLDSQQTCFAKDGLIYCKDDYYKRFPRKCNNCYQAINPNEFVMRARQFIFHLNCFKCMVCERQLNTGEEYGINCKDGSIYCRVHYCPIGDNETGFDYMNNLPPTPGISPSSQGSTPLFNLSLNSVTTSGEELMHGAHKARAKKRKIITDSTNKKSSIGKKAPSKNSPGKDNDNEIAESPDEFLSSANLDNEEDYLDTSASQSGPNQNSGGNGTNYYDSVAAVAAAAAAAAAAQRQKRMRTSFKHHQLRVMKSYFELNHNPDAKDLKQLSQKTGLSKRVLQVWFQNARAKFRRGQTNPCGADPVGELTAMNTSNTGVSSSSTSSISSSSSTSNQQHLAQHIDTMDHEDSSSHSLSLENLDKQLGQSSADISYTLLENTSNYQNQNFMFNSTSNVHLPLNSNYTSLNHHQHQNNLHHHHHLHHQIISHHHNLQSNAAASTQVNDFNSSSLCVDNLII